MALGIHPSNPTSRYNMYGINPFSAQKASNDQSNPPSIFGALPYPGTANTVTLPLHALVTFRFTSLSTTVLDCKVVGPNNETCYRITTDGQGQTLLKDGAGRTIALVAWHTHPTVEAHCIGEKQPVGRWLQLSPDRSSRTMVHGGVRYAWAPFDRFLHLFAPDSSVWLARVTKSVDAVLLELTPRAIQLGLMDAAILATLLLQCGRRID